MGLKFMALPVISKHIEYFMTYCAILVQWCLLWAVVVRTEVLDDG